VGDNIFMNKLIKPKSYFSSKHETGIEQFILDEIEHKKNSTFEDLSEAACIIGYYLFKITAIILGFALGGFWVGLIVLIILSSN
jgi:hypothetical protein